MIAFELSAGAERARALLKLNDFLGRRVEVSVWASGGADSFEIPFLVAQVAGVLGSSTGRAMGDAGPLVFAIYGYDGSPVCDIAEATIGEAICEQWEYEGRIREKVVLHPVEGTVRVSVALAEPQRPITSRRPPP